MNRGIALLALALAACAPAPADRRAGARPAGIVSLNPCTDAILVEVADPAQIRALSANSRNPASSSMDLATAARFASTTGTVEEIAALRPALVVSGTFTAPATRAALARLGIPLVEIPIAGSVEQSLDQVRQLAALSGHPQRGAALIARINAALAQAQPQDRRIVPALVWQSGGIVPGDQTLIADLLRRTGFANAAAARGLGQADFLPLEQVLADPPALIFAAGGRSGEDRLLSHPALNRLPSTRRARLDPALLWCGGPTIIRAAARLSAVRRQLDAPAPGGSSL
ncbi:MAG: ABC transporter substrate-binding protein [Novosphingobium sp.]